MIVPDLNLLLYAYDARSPHHRAAAAWWESCVNGIEPVGLPGVVLFGFMRLATNPRVYAAPLTVAEVAECVAAWMSRPHVISVHGGSRHFAHVAALLQESGSSGQLVTGAQIAAIAIELGATVFSNDSDFARFPAVKVVNPLAL